MSCTAPVYHFETPHPGGWGFQIRIIAWGGGGGESLPNRVTIMNITPPPRVNVITDCDEQTDHLLIL